MHRRRDSTRQLLRVGVGRVYRAPHYHRLVATTDVFTHLKRNQLESYINQRTGAPHWSPIAISVFRLVTEPTRSAREKVIDCSRLSTYGCRAFYYAGPAVWNSLPDELRNLDSSDSFARF